MIDTSMIADHNIIAKITYNNNTAQFTNTGTQFITDYKWRWYNSQVTENGFAIDAILYIALVNQGVQRSLSIKQY